MDFAAVRRGIGLFNRGEFFEAHEVLEDVWRAAPQSEKKFLQGLIQIAVALHHHSRGNLVGAQSLLQRGSRNLAGYRDGFAGVRLRQFLQALEKWQQALASGRHSRQLPRLQIRRVPGHD